MMKSSLSAITRFLRASSRVSPDAKTAAATRAARRRERGGIARGTQQAQHMARGLSRAGEWCGRDA
eukprot:7188683-Prymnesium_polylepis.1